MPPVVTSMAVDNAVAAAKSLPDLARKVAVIDPSLAEALESKALIASKTPWGTLAGGIVAWGAAKFALGWSPEFCTLVGGAGVLVGSFLMRYISSSRIGGVFSARSATPAPRDNNLQAAASMNPYSSATPSQPQPPAQR